MRRLFAALILVTVALTTISCGGEGGEVAVVPTATVDAGAEEQSPREDTLAPTLTVDPDDSKYPMQWPATKSRTPKAVQQRLDDRQPMILVYIDTKQRNTNDQRSEISAVMGEYGDMIDVVYYDITNQLSASKQKDNAEIGKAAALASELGVSFTPHLLFIDQSGRITWEFNGYADRKLIEREVLAPRSSAKDTGDERPLLGRGE